VRATTTIKTEEPHEDENPAEEMEVHPLAAQFPMRPSDQGFRAEVSESMAQKEWGLCAIMQEIKAWAPHAQVVFLATAFELPSFRTCFAEGAAGYLLEDISREGLQHSW
jgi:hypothetical protein